MCDQVRDEAGLAQRVMTLRVEVGESLAVGLVPEGRLTIIPITVGRSKGRAYAARCMRVAQTGT